MNRIHALLLLLVMYSALGHAFRIAASSPAVTENMFTLGLSNSLVAVSQGSNYPIEARKIARLGTSLKLALEPLLRVKPDYLIWDDEIMNDDDRSRFCRKISCIKWHVRRPQDLVTESKRLMIALDKPVGSILNKLEPISKLNALKFKPFRFAVVVWQQPLMIAGQNLFLVQCLSQMGGVNIINAPVKSMATSIELLFYESDLHLFVMGDGPEDLLKRLMHKKQFRIHPLRWDDYGRATIASVEKLISDVPTWKLGDL